MIFVSMVKKVNRIKEAAFESPMNWGRALNSQFSSKSINEEKGTIEVIMATDTRTVLAYHWEIGYYYEVLGFENGMVRTQRMETSMPIYDRHNTHSFDLGKVDNGRVEGNSLVGTMRFDLEDENGLGKRAFGKFSRGFWTTVSIGYSVYKMRYMEDAPDGKPIYKVTDWEPYELSTAPIPADIEAKVRTKEISQPKIQIEKPNKTRKMDPEIETPEVEKKSNEEHQRALKQAQEKASADERTRVAGIMTICKEHSIDEDFQRQAIEENLTLDSVREKVLEKKKADQTVIKIGKTNGFENDGERTRAMVTGVMHRMNPTEHKLEDNSPARQFNKPLMQLCRDYCVEHNLPVDGDPMQMVKRAMSFGMDRKRGGGLTTSDFPLLFGNLVDAVLRKDYKHLTGEWKKIAFKQNATRINSEEKTLQLGNMTSMKRVLEGGEYKKQAFTEASESFAAYKYGSEFSITLEMIINDDLGAIERMIAQIPKAKTFTEDTLFWSMLFGNPTMNDGKALFHTDHANLGTPGALTEGKLDELYTLVTSQKGLPNSDGTDGEVLDLKPKYVIVGQSNRGNLNRIMNKQVVPGKSSDAPLDYIQGLTPIVTARITDGSYYLTADPDQIEIIRYGGVNGYNEYSVDEIPELRTDEYLWHIRTFFGVRPVDWRGIAKNTVS